MQTTAHCRSSGADPRERSRRIGCPDVRCGHAGPRAHGAARPSNPGCVVRIGGASSERHQDPTAACDEALGRCSEARSSPRSRRVSPERGSVARLGTHAVQSGHPVQCTPREAASPARRCAPRGRGDGMPHGSPVRGARTIARVAACRPLRRLSRNDQGAGDQPRQVGGAEAGRCRRASLTRPSTPRSSAPPRGRRRAWRDPCRPPARSPASRRRCRRTPARRS